MVAGDAGAPGGPEVRYEGDRPSVYTFVDAGDAYTEASQYAEEVFFLDPEARFRVEQHYSSYLLRVFELDRATWRYLKAKLNTIMDTNERTYGRRPLVFSDDPKATVSLCFPWRWPLVEEEGA